MTTKKSLWVLIGFFIIATWLLAIVIEAQAEIMKCRIARVVTKEETMPVSDEEGHALHISMSEGLAFFANGDTAIVKAQGIVDFTPAKGALMITYIFFTFEDRSSIIARLEYHSIVEPSGKMSSKSVGKIIKGAGRFEGIEGTYSSTGKIFPSVKGEAYKFSSDATITYTLPSK